MSDNMIFLVKTYFGQFFMIKKMILTYVAHFGVLLPKLWVAIATDTQKRTILCHFGCHGNQIEYACHAHSYTTSQSTYKYLHYEFNFIKFDEGRPEILLFEL